MDASRSDTARFARSGGTGGAPRRYPELFRFWPFGAMAPPLGRM